MLFVSPSAACYSVNLWGNNLLVLGYNHHPHSSLRLRPTMPASNLFLSSLLSCLPKHYLSQCGLFPPLCALLSFLSKKPSSDHLSYPFQVIASLHIKGWCHGPFFTFKTPLCPGRIARSAFCCHKACNSMLSNLTETGYRNLVQRLPIKPHHFPCLCLMRSQLHCTPSNCLSCSVSV